jgi:hypothetical protein
VIADRLHPGSGVWIRASLATSVYRGLYRDLFCRGPFYRGLFHGHRGGSPHSGHVPSVATGGSCGRPCDAGEIVRSSPRATPPARIRGENVGISYEVPMQSVCEWSVSMHVSRRARCAAAHAMRGNGVGYNDRNFLPCLGAASVRRPSGRRGCGGSPQASQSRIAFEPPALKSSPTDERCSRAA